MGNSSSEDLESELRRWLETAPEGARLPSSRMLVARHGVSPVTVQKVLTGLAALGLVEARTGVGTFKRTLAPTPPADFGWQTAALGAPTSPHAAVSSALRIAPPEVVPLHSGYPDRELLPMRLVRGALARASRGETVVQRPSPAGLPQLQAWFAAELKATTLPGVAPPTSNDVIVMPGSQSGLSTTFRALVGAGKPLIVESPTYWGAIRAAEQAGVTLVPVPSGPQGPDPDELDRAFTRSGARAFYGQPNFANPTGAQWGPSLVDRVLEIVRANGAFLIEDDWAHDFAIDAEVTPVAPQDVSGHVVYLRSLTKSVSPAVRVAAVVARGPARERILAVAQSEAMYVSGFLQSVAVDVVSQPSWRTHLRQLRQDLRSRRDQLVGALRQFAPEVTLVALPRGGLNLWVRLPDDTDLPSLVRECDAKGVSVAPGRDWFPAEPAAQFLRLNYSGPEPGRFVEGAQRLGAAVREHRGGRV